MDAEAHKLAPPTHAPNLLGRLRRFAAELVPSIVLVRHGRPAGNRVALTFDDGPDELTDAYLDALDRLGARATFFVTGKATAARRDALLRIVARGHEVGGHGFTHDRFTTMDAGTLRDELQRTAELLPPARTRRPLLRPPHGAVSLRSLALCTQAGYTTVLWSRDSDDCRTDSADEVAARMQARPLHPGDIVLLHEGQPWTLAALPRIMDHLAAGGFQAVTVGELLEPNP